MSEDYNEWPYDVDDGIELNEAGFRIVDPEDAAPSDAAQAFLDANKDPSEEVNFDEMLDVLELVSYGDFPADKKLVEESRAFAMAIARTILAPQQRLVYEAKLSLGAQANDRQVAEAVGIKCRNAGTTQGDVRGKIRKAFDSLAQEEGHDYLARDFLLMHFFPELLRDATERPVQFAKLAMAGIVFTDDGRIDLSASNSNRFHTTVFRTVDGGYVSGIDLMESRNSREKPVRNIRDFFLRDNNVDDDLVIFPEGDVYTSKMKCNKGPLTRNDALAAVMDPVNLRKISDIAHLRLGSDGRWHLFMSTAQFRTRWCAFNGGDLKTGKKLLSLWGMGVSQPNVKKFFQMVFGENLNFIEASHVIGKGIPIEAVGQEGILFDLRSAKNKKQWRVAHVMIGDGRCKIYTKTEDLDCNIKFWVCGKLYLAEKVFQWLGLPQNRPGMVRFCELVFPDKEVVDRRRGNGTLILDESDIDLIVHNLQFANNVRRLRALAEEHDGKIVVDLSMRHMEGELFTIVGRPYSMRTLLSKLKWPVNGKGILRIYRKVFYKILVVKKSDLEGVQIQNPTVDQNQPWIFAEETIALKSEAA